MGSVVLRKFLCFGRIIKRDSTVVRPTHAFSKREGVMELEGTGAKKSERKGKRKD